MYLFLTTKYNLLLVEEKAEKLKAENEAKKAQEIREQKLKTAKPSVPKLATLVTSGKRKSWGVSSKDLKIDNSPKIPPKKAGIPKQGGKTTPNNSKRIVSARVDVPDLASPSTDEAQNDAQPSIAVEVEAPVEEENEPAEPEEPAEEEPEPAPAPVEEPAGITCSPVRRTAEVVFECKLCNKIFGSKNMLETHISFSQLHKQAIEDRAVKFQEIIRHAERLANLARASVEAMQDKLVLKKKQKNGRMTMPEFHWKHSISKVIDRYLKARYYDVLAVNPKTHFPVYTALAPNPKLHDAKLIYSGSKFFWRVRAAFKIDVYLHAKCGTLEVIPQLVQAETAGDLASPTKQREKGAFDRNCSRMYLSRDALDQMMRSEAPEVSSPTSQRRDAVFKSVSTSALPPAGPHVQSHANAHTHSQFAAYPSVDEQTDDEEDEVDPEECSDEEEAREARAHRALHRATPEERDLAQFLVNKIKVDYQGVDKKTVHLLRSLFFDECSLKGALSPVLVHPPLSLVPVSIAVDKTYQQWEVKLKMKQVEESRTSLAQAVTSAYVKAKDTTQLLSPKASFHLSTKCGFAPKISPRSQPGSRPDTGKRWSFSM